MYIEDNQLKIINRNLIDYIMAEDCVICLTPLSSPLPRYQLNCNHEYHRECITEWLKHNDTCPLCRRRIDADHRYLVDEILDEARFEEIFHGLKGWTALFGMAVESVFPQHLQGWTEYLMNNEMLDDELREFGSTINTPPGENLAKLGAEALEAWNTYQTHNRASSTNSTTSDPQN